MEVANPAMLSLRYLKQAEGWIHVILNFFQRGPDLSWYIILLWVIDYIVQEA